MLEWLLSLFKRKDSKELSEDIECAEDSEGEDYLIRKRLYEVTPYGFAVGDIQEQHTLYSKFTDAQREQFVELYMLYGHIPVCLTYLCSQGADSEHAKVEPWDTKLLNAHYLDAEAGRLFKVISCESTDSGFVLHLDSEHAAVQILCTSAIIASRILLMREMYPDWTPTAAFTNGTKIYWVA